MDRGRTLAGIEMAAVTQSEGTRRKQSSRHECSGSQSSQESGYSRIMVM